MNRKDLKIGNRVRVRADWTNKDKPAPKSSLMYVRELHNGNTAGLSYSMETPPEDCYGTLYSVIREVVDEEQEEWFNVNPKLYNGKYIPEGVMVWLWNENVRKFWVERDFIWPWI